MKSSDIETYYSKYKLTVKVASDFVGSKMVDKLITSCRLKAYASFTHSLNRASSLQRHWVDEFGNSIYLKSGRVTTTLKDKSIKKITTTSSDLFFLRSMLDIMNMSQAMVVCPDHFLFYGQDEYFRCFNMDGERASALEIGAEELIMLLGSIKNRFKKFGKGFAIYSLPNEEIKMMIKKEYSK